MLVGEGCVFFFEFFEKYIIIALPPQRQLHPKVSPCTRLAVHAYAAFVLLHNGIGNEKPQPAALRFALSS